MTARIAGSRGRAASVATRCAVWSLLVLCRASCLVPAAPAGADEGTLRDRIGAGKSRERSLAERRRRGSGELERKATREVAILEGRLGAAQQELDAAETRLAATEARETAARRRVTPPAQAARRGARQAQPGCCASATWAVGRTSSPSSCTPTASRSCSRR